MTVDCPLALRHRSSKHVWHPYHCGAVVCRENADCKPAVFHSLTSNANDGLTVADSQVISDDLAAERDRLYGPAAAQVKKQLGIQEHRHAQQARCDIWWIFRARMQVGSRRKRRRREARERAEMCTVNFLQSALNACSARLHLPQPQNLDKEP